MGGSCFFLGRFPCHMHMHAMRACPSPAHTNTLSVLLPCMLPCARTCKSVQATLKTFFCTACMSTHQFATLFIHFVLVMCHHSCMHEKAPHTRKNGLCILVKCVRHTNKKFCACEGHFEAADCIIIIPPPKAHTHVSSILAN